VLYSDLKFQDLLEEKRNDQSKKKETEYDSEEEGAVQKRLEQTHKVLALVTVKRLLVQSLELWNFNRNARLSIYEELFIL
jgi:hypothetical protein